MSNLKYESVRIDFKTVVFIRAYPGKKKPQTDLVCMSILFGIGALFRKWEFRKMARDQNFKSP